MILQAHWGTLLKELCPWRDGGEWDPDWSGRLVKALLEWDPEECFAVDEILDGDPYAAAEHALVRAGDVIAKTANYIVAPYRSFLEQLLSGNWVRHTIFLWRELIFLGLTNGGDEWAVLAWRPTSSRLVTVEVINARLYFAPTAPDKKTLHPESDGYLWAGYMLTKLRAAAWLTAGFSPETGEEIEPRSPVKAMDHVEEALVRHGIVFYTELPLERRRSA